MSLSQDDVKKIAHLARIELSDSEIDELSPELTNILDMVAQMDKVDTTGIKPMAHPFDAMQRLRTDEVTEVNQRDYFQQLAPDTEQGLYLVDKVMED
jgi:aspartyl-tRNA(Asn)/glutamyl-tRNA(Gln) amidotransferase subunit C